MTAIAPAVGLAIDPSTQYMDGARLVRCILDDWGGSAWIGDTDTMALQLLADGWDEALRLRAYLTTNGYHNRTGRIRPEATRLGVVEKNLTTWMAMLGLTPTERTRLGVSQVRAASKLEQLADRRAARQGRFT